MPRGFAGFVHVEQQSKNRFEPRMLHYSRSNSTLNTWPLDFCFPCFDTPVRCRCDGTSERIYAGLQFDGTGRTSKFCETHWRQSVICFEQHGFAGTFHYENAPEYREPDGHRATRGIAIYGGGRPDFARGCTKTSLPIAKRIAAGI